MVKINLIANIQILSKYLYNRVHSILIKWNKWCMYSTINKVIKDKRHFRDYKSGLQKVYIIMPLLIAFALLSWHLKKKINTIPESVTDIRSKETPGNEEVPGEKWKKSEVFFHSQVSCQI